MKEDAMHTSIEYCPICKTTTNQEVRANGQILEVRCTKCNRILSRTNPNGIANYIKRFKK